MCPRSLCVLLFAVSATLAQTAVSSPQVAWFSPLAPGLWPDGHNGASDFMALFSPAAAWPAASSHIQIFKIANSAFSGDLPGALSDNQWRQVFSELTRRGIGLALEWGPLEPIGCGYGVEGFENDALQMAQRIKALGGDLRFIAMDEPFYFGSIYDGPGACHWNAQTIASNALQSIAKIRTVFPNVAVGDIEPVLGEDVPDWLTRYTEWLDAWRNRAGAPLAFFHCDVLWWEDWMTGVENFRRVLYARGVPFGIIYNGSAGHANDLDWIREAEGHFLDYELHGGVTPDHVVFQSWDPHPSHVLPESDPSSLTYLVARYFRKRTTLSISRGPGQAAGKLLDLQGTPVPAATVTLSLHAIPSAGAIPTYTLTGTVPPGIRQALVQICVNECGTRGNADMNIYSFQYSDTAQKAALDFSRGLSDWDIEPVPGHAADVEFVADSTGKSVWIQANPSQNIFVNSTIFAVTPGSAFQLAVQARIAMGSSASGYFAVIFLADKEVARATLPFGKGDTLLGKTQTATDGTYSLQFTPQPAGFFQLQAGFEGSDQYWPAYGSVSLDDSPFIRANGVLSGATLKATPLSPGAFFSVFGQNLGKFAQWTSPSTYQLGGAQVLVCGAPAVISYNSGPVVSKGTVEWQLNAIVPDIAPIGSTCPVVVVVDGRISQSASLPIVPGRMELFVFPTYLGLLPILTHADYSIAGPAEDGLVPAKAGETIVAWGTGDCTWPAITVGGTGANVTFALRVAPGLCQFNFVVPQLPAGSYPLKIATAPDTYPLWVR